MGYLPDPINQFYRLIQVSGPQGTGYYTAGSEWNNWHYDPDAGRTTDYDNRNCTAAIGALLRDSHTGGKERSTPIAIRNHQNDFHGGIGWDDVNIAWWDLFGDRLTLPPDADWWDVISALRNGRHVGIQGDYDQVPYSYQVQKGGTFDHAFGLFGYRTSDSRVLLYDPLGRKMVWVPQSVIRPAAEKLALAQRGTKSRLFVAYTRIVPAGTTPAPLPSVKVSIHPPEGRTAVFFWAYNMVTVNGVLQIKAGSDPGRDRQRTGGFTASATAPKNYTWPGVGSRVLCRITTGAWAGTWVESRYIV